MMRRMVAGRPNLVQDYVLHKLGFTWGVPVCSMALGMYMFVAICLGWFLMSYLSRARTS